MKIDVPTRRRTGERTCGVDHVPGLAISEHLLGLAVTVGILIVLVLLAIRSVERASAELGRCEPCRIDEGVAREFRSSAGWSWWTWVSPMCCERDGTRRKVPPT